MTLPPIASQPADAKSAAQPSPQLKKAATEFEGMLISTLWKGLLDDPMGGLDSSADPASGSIQSLGMQAMSTAISASGGLGLAKMVERQLTPRPPASGVPASKQPLKFGPKAADIPLGEHAAMYPLTQHSLMNPLPKRPGTPVSIRPGRQTGGGE